MSIEPIRTGGNRRPPLEFVIDMPAHPISAHERLAQAADMIERRSVDGICAVSAEFVVSFYGWQHVIADPELLSFIAVIARAGLETGVVGRIFGTTLHAAVEVLPTTCEGIAVMAAITSGAGITVAAAGEEGPPRERPQQPYAFTLHTDGRIDAPALPSLFERRRVAQQLERLVDVLRGSYERRPK